MMSSSDASQASISAMGGQSGQGGRGNRKKTRDSKAADDTSDYPYNLGDDSRPKTRRVNPQRLAKRLAPALVAEMEALIVPGAKMPTFTVRKDFQERYSVDRRHIYDYFHSRGLRVAKEDKHTNLIRGRAMKAAAQAAASQDTTPAAVPQAEKVASPQKASPELEPVTNAFEQTVPDSSCKPKAQGQSRLYKRKKSNKGAAKKVFIAPSDSHLARESSASVSETSPLPTSVAAFSAPRLPPTVPGAYLPGENSDTSAGLDTPPSTNYFFPPEVPQALTSLHGPITGGSAFYQDQLFTMDPANYLDAYDSMHSYGEKAMTTQERADLYTQVQNSLYPASLSGESAGTYDAYMKERASISDRTLYGASSGRPNRDQVHIEQPPPFAAHSLGNEVSPDLSDLRAWLSEDLTREDEYSGQPIAGSSGHTFAVARPMTIFASDGTLVSRRFR
ncbi:hypothetical protein BKA70DRAFT_1137791 [Coprinopsis sp. MPI-PUGE-AT-0042]|nr:hypothetical protein BKA70DRAFT_1137791 [Coprinopsis sp. MPI-PUGE-AT-0042]